MRRATLGVVALVLVWTAAAAFVLATPGGLRALCVVARYATHDTFTVTRVQGSVLGGFVAEELAWNGAQGAHLALARVQFAWTPLTLLRGTLHVNMLELDGLRVRQTATREPVHARQPLHVPAGLPLNLRVDALVLRDMEITSADGKHFDVPQARLQASWMGRRLRIQSLDVTTAATGAVHLTADAVTRADALEIRTLAITGPGTLNAHGRLGYDTTASDLQLVLRDFKWPVIGKTAGATLHAVQGTVHLNGTLANYAVEAQLTAQARGRSVQLQVQGSGTPQAVQLAKLHFTLDRNGRVDGHGRVQLAPQLAADLDLDVARFNPAPLAPGFPGDINGRVRIRTTPVAGGQRIDVNARIANSRLRGQPLKLEGVAGAEDTDGAWRVDVEKLNAALGATTLTAAGRVTPPFAVHGHVASPDLVAVYPDWGGRVDADFKISGTRAAPVLTTRGEAVALHLAGLRAAHAQWDVRLDVPGTSDVTATLQDVNFGGTVVERVQLTGGGTTRNHHLELDVASPQADARLAVAGGYDVAHRTWRGRLTALTLVPKRPAGLLAWRLDGQPQVVAGPRDATLAPACLTDGHGRLCLNATRQGTTAHAAFTLADVQLADFAALLPRRVKVAGALDGDGDVQWRNAQLVARTQLRMASGQVSVNGAPPIAIMPSQVRASVANGAIHASVDLETARGTLSADLHAQASAGAALKDAPLSGTLTAEIPDVAFLAAFAGGEVKDLHGHVAGTLQVSGSVDAPDVSGRVALEGGAVTLPLAGVTLADVELALSGNNDAPLNLSGAATSGGGTLALAGTLDARHWPVSVELHVTGSDFQVLDTSDARVWVAPDLVLARTPEGVDVSGSLFVPRAELTPRGGLTEHGVAVSPDQVIVGAPPRTAAPAPNISAQVALVLGKQVTFDGFGLKTHIAGGVVLRQEPRGAALAQGQLYLENGRYKAYGQDLTIKTGRLIFDGGPVTKPAIDIVATRQPRSDMTVGVQVRGTLDKPQLTLTSTPAMPQQQQLSWLLFGRPLDQSSGSDQSAIAAAALSLGLGGGAYLANQIGHRLGIDDVAIGAAPGGGSAVATNADTIAASAAAQGYGAAQASQAAQLTLGKYLTPRLYVSYGVSLFQPGQVFRLLYDLGHGFKLQTESGVTNGGDLLYTFETGK